MRALGNFLVDEHHAVVNKRLLVVRSRLLVIRRIHALRLSVLIEAWVALRILWGGHLRIWLGRPYLSEPLLFFGFIDMLHWSVCEDLIRVWQRVTVSLGIYILL